MRPSFRSTLAAALQDARRTWPQLVLADLMARVLAVVILTPVVGLLLRVFLTTTTTGVVTDAAIVTFLLHPAGMVALVVVGAVSVGLLFAESGTLMVIGFGAIENRRVTWLEAMRYAYRYVMPLVHLAGRAITSLAMMTVPFLFAIGVLYWLLLSTFDINYYLTERPPAFWIALISAGALLTALAILIVSRLAGWLLALPLVLFEGLGGKEALQRSESTTRSSRGGIALAIWGWFLTVALLSTVVTTVLGALSDVLIPWGSTSMTFVLIGIGAMLAVNAVTQLVVAVFMTVLVPLLVVRWYRASAGPGELRPAIAAPGSLADRPSGGIPGKWVLVAGASAAFVIAIAGVLALRGMGAEDTPQVIAHRGGGAVAPENTMAAFRRAIAEGADWLELDVQENADGVVVVEHDRDFMRVAGRDLDVWRARAADLADLDVGSAFGPEFSEERVPELRQVLELARGQAGVFIELKYYGHDVELETKVVDLVEATGVASDIVVMSLEYEGIRKMAALRPEWTYGLLNVVSLGDLTRLEVDFLALSANAASLAMIRRAHRHGMRVYAWTVNDPVQMMTMMSRGVDGIITDRVALARQVIEARETLTPVGRVLVWLAAETGLLGDIDRSSAADDA
jgi:glycerophosphoryl diester phosphodiesterase